MIYQPEIMRTNKSLALEEVGRARFENEELVRACVLYAIALETPVWVAGLVARQFGIPDEVLALARNGDDVRRLAAESYLIASKKGTEWAIKRALRICGIVAELVYSMQVRYDGTYKHIGTIAYSGDSLGGVFNVWLRVIGLEGRSGVDEVALFLAVREMLPVRCRLVGVSFSNSV